MREPPERLLMRIRLGKDGTIEFREAAFSGGEIAEPGRNELADELAAFANARGGMLVLGVAGETRQVVGIPPDRQEDVERYVSTIVQESIDPPLYPDIGWYELPDSNGRLRPILRGRSSAACSCTGVPAATCVAWGARYAGLKWSLWPVCSSSGARNGLSVSMNRSWRKHRSGTSTPH